MEAPCTAYMIRQPEKRNARLTEESFDWILYRKCLCAEQTCSGADGRRDGPAFPGPVQGTGGRPSVYGNGQCKSCHIQK